MANVAKLEAVLDYIRAHPEEHDQYMWAQKYEDFDLPGGCGTTLCFAGTAVVLNGHQIVWNDDCRIAELCTVPPDFASVLYDSRPGPGQGFIDEVAQRILDLDDDQARRLFINSETFDDVERVVKDIINEQTP